MSVCGGDLYVTAAIGINGDIVKVIDVYKRQLPRYLMRTLNGKQLLLQTLVLMLLFGVDRSMSLLTRCV